MKKFIGDFSNAVTAIVFVIAAFGGIDFGLVVITERFNVQLMWVIWVPILCGLMYALWQLIRKRGA